MTSHDCDKTLPPPSESFFVRYWW